MDRFSGSSATLHWQAPRARQAAEMSVIFVTASEEFLTSPLLSAFGHMNCQFQLKFISLAGRVGLSGGMLGIFVGWYVEHLDSPVVVRYCTGPDFNIVYITDFQQTMQIATTVGFTLVYLGSPETS